MCCLEVPQTKRKSLGSCFFVLQVWPAVGACACPTCSLRKQRPFVHNSVCQRQRDDNKNKISAFEGGGPRGQRGKPPKNAVFRWKRHDNKILKVFFLLSRNFVVVAQAPSLFAIFGGSVRNFGGVFAILFEVLLIEIQEEIHHFAGWEGGGLIGAKIVNKNFVNKLGVS